MGNDSSTIKKFKALDSNHYYIITDRDSIDIEINDIEKGLATFHHAGEIRDQARTYIDTKKADKYKLTKYDCDE
jgi:hypothetical protein